MQRLDRAEALGGQHLLAIEAGGRHEAGVDRCPATAAVRLRPVDQHGAGTAFALGATFLAPGQPVRAQPVEERDVSAHIPEGTIEAIDCQLRFHLNTLPSTSVTILPPGRIDLRQRAEMALASETTLTHEDWSIVTEDPLNHQRFWNSDSAMRSIWS